MPRPDAHEVVSKACKRAESARRDLRTVLAQDAIVKGILSGAELDRLFTPANYLGVADQFIDRVLTSSAAQREQKKPRKK
jgi:3-carboxy-cis,cis-muconate cycloisomerase